VIDRRGCSADTFGKHGHSAEIADSCTSAQKIAAAYEQVVRTLRVTRLDMDLESNAETYAAGVNRRDGAIAIAQRWAARRGIRLQIQFTLPVEPNGLGRRVVLGRRTAACAQASSRRDGRGGFRQPLRQVSPDTARGSMR